MIVYQLGCLFITYVVLQTYIVKGVHSRTHRLLPLVMGLIGLYNFYKVFEWLTYEHYLFGRLADMLTLQMLYLVIHYVVDFMYIDTLEKELELLEGCGQIDSDEERKALEMLKQSAQEYEYDEGIEVLKDIMKKG